MLGVNPVERGPDRVGVVAVLAAGEGDLRAGGQHDLGVRPSAGGDEVAAVDIGGGQRLAVDARAVPGLPHRADVRPVEVCGGFAHDVERLAAFEQGAD